MEQKTIKIQVLNDTKLCVLPVLPDLKTVVPVESISGLTVSWGIRGHETDPVAVQIENGYIVLPISATMPLGVYSVHMQGTINGEQWSDNRHEMFELVQYGEGIRYDRYYTTTVIVGLPDETLAQIIAELEAKRDEYQHLVDELNRGEVATKSDLGLQPGETVAGLIKAGGGGGITPEQYNALAKEETSQAILAAVSLTAAQADEDWQNVQPITE